MAVTAIYMYECHIIWRMTNKWHCYLIKLKSKNLQITIKKTAPLFLFLEPQMHLVSMSQRVSFAFFFNFVETIFNIKDKNTYYKIYTYTVTCKFPHNINPTCCVMPIFKCAFTKYDNVANKRVWHKIIRICCCRQMILLCKC